MTEKKHTITPDLPRGVTHGVVECEACGALWDVWYSPYGLQFKLRDAVDCTADKGYYEEVQKAWEAG